MVNIHGTSLVGPERGKPATFTLFPDPLRLFPLCGPPSPLGQAWYTPWGDLAGLPREEAWGVTYLKASESSSVS